MKKTVYQWVGGVVVSLAMILTPLTRDKTWADEPPGARVNLVEANLLDTQQQDANAKRSMSVLDEAADGSITGKVTNESDQPLTPVAVALYQSVLDSAGKRRWVRQYTTGTAANGIYRFTNVEPGQYRIRFSYEGTPHSYGAEYYKDAAIIDGAQDVEVKSGAQLTGYNAQLARTGAITGQVADKDGAHLAGIKVSAYRYVTDNTGKVLWPRELKVFTNSNGDYQLTEMDAGRYRLFFEYPQWPLLYLPQYYPNAATLDAAADITVTPGISVTGVNMLLDKTGHVTGKVVDEDNHPLAGVRVILYRYIVDSSGHGQRFYYREAVTDADGNYDLANIPPDNYRLRFLDSVKPARYQSEYYNDEADVGRATALVMQGNEIINSIDAQIAPYNPKSNSAPVAVDDRFLVVDSGQDGSSTIVSGDVLANDSDPDGDPLTAEIVSTPVSGTVEFNADGRFQYQANSGALITDSFTYYVSDGKHESNLATVTIMVIPLAEVVQVFLPIVQK